jgi:hypothetical protein
MNLIRAFNQKFVFTFFDALANGSKEHSFVGDGGAVGITKEALTDELYTIRNNPDYLVEGKNKLLIKRSNEIHKMLYPEPHVFKCISSRTHFILIVFTPLLL